MIQEIVLSEDEFYRSLKYNIKIPHAILLGAGASIESSIPSATDCIWKWKKDIYVSKTGLSLGINDNLSLDEKNVIQEWLNQQGIVPASHIVNEYSFYAEKALPIEEDRRRFFHGIIHGKYPSIGYHALALLAKQEIVKSVWTTNFDGLMPMVAHIHALTPIEIFKDNAISRLSMAFSSTELPCIALHGDYKFGGLKNSERELDTQEEIFQEAFSHFITSQHLIVIGYSGRDHSLMQLIEQVFLKFHGGRIYWCGYGSDISEAVISLLCRLKTNGTEVYYIQISGFDETLLRVVENCIDATVLSEWIESLPQELAISLEIKKILGSIRAKYKLPVNILTIGRCISKKKVFLDMLLNDKDNEKITNNDKKLYQGIIDGIKININDLDVKSSDEEWKTHFDLLIQKHDITVSPAEWFHVIIYCISINKRIEQIDCDIINHMRSKGNSVIVVFLTDDMLNSKRTIQCSKEILTTICDLSYDAIVTIPIGDKLNHIKRQQAMEFGKLKRFMFSEWKKMIVKQLPKRCIFLMGKEIKYTREKIFSGFYKFCHLENASEQAKEYKEEEYKVEENASNILQILDLMNNNTFFYDIYHKIIIHEWDECLKVALSLSHIFNEQNSDIFDRFSFRSIGTEIMVNIIKNLDIIIRTHANLNFREAITIFANKKTFMLFDKRLLGRKRDLRPIILHEIYHTFEFKTIAERKEIYDTLTEQISALLFSIQEKINSTEHELRYNLAICITN